MNNTEKTEKIDCCNEALKMLTSIPVDILIQNDEDILDKLHTNAAREIAVSLKKRAIQEVEDYIESEDFKLFVELLKRRERERVLAEVQEEMQTEKFRMMSSQKMSVEEDLNQVLLNNKLVLEEQQRRDYETKQLELRNAERLKEIQSKQQREVSFFSCPPFKKLSFARICVIYLQKEELKRQQVLKDTSKSSELKRLCAPMIQLILCEVLFCVSFILL